MSDYRNSELPNCSRQARNQSVVEFHELYDADLVVDCVYLGGTRGTAGDDPIARLLPVGNQGGFRFKGSPQRRSVSICVLYTSGVEADWPDRLDPSTGDFTYFGDNRRPGSQLLATARKGNLLLQDVFDRTHGIERARASIPPFLLFEKHGRGRDVVFRGLLAPGSPRLSPEEELVAVWRTSEGRRFQNYRAHFTVLNVPVVSRQWLNAMHEGRTLDALSCPPAWADWVSGVFRPLEAPRTRTVRSRQAQSPTTRVGQAMIRLLYAHFSDAPTRFEGFAADLWLMSDQRVASVDVTRPSRDGGRDATGEYLLGPGSDPIRITFALEAKCYAPTNGVGVREVSRLISRIRSREFGILVTTSYLADQAYQEIRDDGHPIIVLAAADIISILSQVGIRTEAALNTYLMTQHPAPQPVAYDRAMPSIDVIASDLFSASTTEVSFAPQRDTTPEIGVEESASTVDADAT